jgi:APA family basic amino acid/polyamine antiporter
MGALIRVPATPCKLVPLLTGWYLQIMDQLNRIIGPKGLTLYGIGVTLGAGIYALVGEMAGVAGGHAPIAFLLAGGLALLTGLSYAELGSRYPESAGEAAYVAAGFDTRAITALAGYGVVLSGCVSASVVLHGFAGYLQTLIAIPGWIAILAGLFGLSAVAIWGIRESIWLAGVITVIEATGLVIIVYVAAPDALASTQPIMPLSDIPWTGLFLAAVMAFFAFIGFEDIVNMAEEVKSPERNLPIAILVTLAVSILVYFAVAWVSVRALPPDVLAQEGGPLAAVYEAATGRSGRAIASIAVLAMINGALVQIIMASRVLYGLGRRGLAPKVFKVVHPVRKTPIWATLVAASLIGILALTGAMGGLAVAASSVTLIVFALVNASLIAIRVRYGKSEAGFTAPIWAPVLGVGANLAVVVGVIGAAING